MPNTFNNLSLKNKRSLSLLLIFVCILYIGLILFAKPEKILDSFAKLTTFSWLFVLSCSLSNYFLRFLRWHYYLRYLRHHIPALQHILYYMAGFALTLTPGKIGETIRSTYLAQHDVPYTTSLAMFFSERFLDLTIIALLSLLVLLFNQQDTTRNFVLLSTAIIVSFIPLLRQNFVAPLLTRFSQKMPWHRLKQLLLHLSYLLTSARALFKSKPVYIGFFLGSIAWSIQGLAFYYILNTLEVDISLQQSIGIYAISLLAGALSFIPGGIGTTETAMVLLLNFLGADIAVAVSVAIISRLSTLWFAVVLGFISATVLTVKEN